MIVHISRDIPDPVDPGKTRTIATLIDLARPEFEGEIYSLNRVPLRSGALSRAAMTKVVARSPGMTTIRYQAPAGGVFLSTILKRVAKSIIADLEGRGVRPSLVHSHKLSIEGIAGRRVARHFGCPHVVTLQGNSDRKIVAARPDLRAEYRRIFHGASVVFAHAPWILSWMEGKLGPRPGDPSHTRVIPCPTTADEILPPRITGPHLITAFNFDQLANKNAFRMVEAAADVRSRVLGFSFTFLGSGSDRSTSRLRSEIEKFGGNSIRIGGAVPNDRMQSVMNGAAGFILPSRRETFGLVFSEALLAGCPIAYPSGTAVDGYFDEEEFAIAVSSDHVASIADGMHRLVSGQAAMKQKLGQWQASGAAERCRRAGIGSAYRDGLRAALGRSEG